MKGLMGHILYQVICSLIMHRAEGLNMTGLYF